MFKIAIIGPESTGKTQLARELAKYFNTSWVPEYARAYVEGLNRPYTYEDVCSIARKQLEEENALRNNSQQPIVFFDTELIITKVWFEYKYGSTPDFVLDQLNKKIFDLYLLCAADLHWEEDPVREHGDDRDYFFDWYKREIELLGKPYVIVRGSGHTRTDNAIAAVNHLISKNKPSI